MGVVIKASGARLSAFSSSHKPAKRNNNKEKGGKTKRDREREKARGEDA